MITIKASAHARHTKQKVTAEVCRSGAELERAMYNWDWVSLLDLEPTEPMAMDKIATARLYRNAMSPASEAATFGSPPAPHAAIQGCRD